MPTKLRVKLITLPWELEVPTLTLASLAAVTPEEYFDICIVDLLRERLILDEPVDLVGISASTPKINAAYALADFYRRRGTKVVIGGHHVTAMPEEGLAHADAIVCGEGETAWMRICDQMLTSPNSIEGIYRDPPPDLATLPQPRMDLMKIHRYQPFYYPLIASRGCSEGCSFCFAKRMTRGYRTYPISHVIEQVRRRPKWIQGSYFVDDNLAGDLDYTRELFRELKKVQIPFGMQVRHEFSQDPDNLRLAKEAGCGLVSSGFESVNQSTLDKTGKHANADLYKQIIKNIQDQGIVASANWMFGFDWDTPDLFQRTWEFLRDSEIFHSTFTVEIPFPGTPTYNRYAREGRLVTEDYDRYIGKGSALVKPKQMTVEELESGIRWLMLKYYSVRHRSHMLRLALKNPKLLEQFPIWMKYVVFLFMNTYEVYLTQYRSRPALRWLYDRLTPYNKYKYVTDLFHGTNFWGKEWVPAFPQPVKLSTASPFAEAAGEMAPGQLRLRPVAREVVG